MPAQLRSIAIAAHDAGGAAALLPVVRELEKRGREVVAVAAGPAVSVLAELPSLERMDDRAGAASLTALFQRRHVGTLISASGLYNEIEHTARLAARELKLPVIAVQDAWFNHRERYERDHVSSRPDRVCVMDERSRREMLELGFAAGQIEVTGHPGLEDTRRRCLSIAPVEIAERRRQLGVRDGALVVTFFSDPFYVGPSGEFYSGPGAIMRPDGQGLYGYTVRDILPQILAELEAACGGAGADVDLVVRPHPSECDEVVTEIVRSFYASRVRARVIRTGSTIDWIQVSDALLGMMTIALLQGAVAEKPAVSVEIGLRETGEEDPCMASTLGYALSVLDRPALAAACRALARRDWAALRPAPAEPLYVNGAAGRIADCVGDVEASA